MTHEREDPVGEDGAMRTNEKSDSYTNNSIPNTDKSQDENRAEEETKSGIDLLEDAPPTIDRPLTIIDGHAYAVTTGWRSKTSDKLVETMVVLRDDGQVFGADDKAGLPLISDLRITIGPGMSLPDDRSLRVATVKRYVKGMRSEPGNVFQRVVDITNHFVHFHRSVADHNVMCELIACFVIGTYLLPAFDVVPYLWPTGERGSGKTQLLSTVSETALLGTLILAGGSYASVRDAVGLGATVCFDDAESIEGDKRELILAGSRRGAHVTRKAPVGARDWGTVRTHAFSPKAFSSIGAPDPILASRTILIPMVRSPDRERGQRDPQDHSAWPHECRQLVDDLWILGLANVTELRAFDRRAVARARLTGRDLDTWRMILAVALWLEEKHGVAGLFHRMEALSVTCVAERNELEAPNDQTCLVIKALIQMISVNPGNLLVFDPTTLAEHVNQIARALGLVESNKDFTNSKSVGWTLTKLRVKKTTAGKTRKRYQITKQEVHDLAQAYGLTLEGVENAEKDQNAENGGEEKQ